jgi:hypothetical protein
MGEEWKESQVDWFTIPGKGVCLSLKTDKTELEIDLPQEIFQRLMAGLTKNQPS